MDMKGIPQAFHGIDLLWSEGAAYNIGFANALATWAPALTPDGFAVVSELSWLKEQAPPVVTEFFRSCYPDMRPVPHNVAAAEGAGSSCPFGQPQNVALSQVVPRHRKATTPRGQ